MCDAACFTSASLVWSKQLLSESGFIAVSVLGEDGCLREDSKVSSLLLSLTKFVATGGLYICEGGHRPCVSGQTGS